MRSQDIHKQQQQRDNELRTSRNSTCLLNYISSNRNLKESISSLSNTEESDQQIQQLTPFFHQFLLPQLIESDGGTVL